MSLILSRTIGALGWQGLVLYKQAIKPLHADALSRQNFAVPAAQSVRDLITGDPKPGGVTVQKYLDAIKKAEEMGLDPLSDEVLQLKSELIVSY